MKQKGSIKVISTVLVVIVMVAVLLFIIVVASVVMVEIGSSGDSDCCNSFGRCYFKVVVW